MNANSRQRPRIRSRLVVGVAAGWLISLGSRDLIYLLQFAGAGLVERFINLFIRQAFRDVLPISEFPILPLGLVATLTAEAIVLLGLGILIAFLVSSSREHQPTVPWAGVALVEDGFGLDQTRAAKQRPTPSK